MSKLISITIKYQFFILQINFDISIISDVKYKYSKDIETNLIMNIPIIKFSFFFSLFKHSYLT